MVVPDIIQQIIPLKHFVHWRQHECTQEVLTNSWTSERFSPFQYLFSHGKWKSPTWDLRRLKREKTPKSSHTGILPPSCTSLRNLTDDSKLDILLVPSVQNRISVFPQYISLLIIVMILCKSKSQSSVTTSVKPVSLPYKHGFQINRDNQSTFTYSIYFQYRNCKSRN